MTRVWVDLPVAAQRVTTRKVKPAPTREKLSEVIAAADKLVDDLRAKNTEFEAAHPGSPVMPEEQYDRLRLELLLKFLKSYG